MFNVFIFVTLVVSAFLNWHLLQRLYKYESMLNDVMTLNVRTSENVYKIQHQLIDINYAVESGVTRLRHEVGNRGCELDILRVQISNLTDKVEASHQLIKTHTHTL